MNRIRFKIVPECGLSLYEQIKSQIISSLYTGKIQQGESLPSVRELAESAGVNPKTIYKVYRQLQEEGYIRMVHGKGVFLRHRTEEDFSALRRDALLHLVRATLEKASLLGLGADKFSQLLARYTCGGGPPLPCILVDDEEEVLAFSSELQRKLPVNLYPILLDELENRLVPDNSELEPYRYILTTSWHLEKVRAAAAPLGRRILEIKPNPRIYTEIAQLMKEKNIGVVVRDMRTLHTSFEVFTHIFYPSTSKTFLITPVGNRPLLEQIAREADVVFVSPCCLVEVQAAVGDRCEIRTFQDFISNDFVDDLRMLQMLE
jgi:GntR family transcriptional regulator